MLPMWNADPNLTVRLQVFGFHPLPKFFPLRKDNYNRNNNKKEFLHPTLHTYVIYVGSCYKLSQPIIMKKWEDDRFVGLSLARFQITLRKSHSYPRAASKELCLILAVKLGIMAF